MSFMKTTASTEETMQLGRELAKRLGAGDVITLSGDLGAGKTTFTKGLAEGLGIKEMVNSPTFTIIKEYNGTLPLYHMDVYRIDGDDEDLGFEEYFSGDGVTVVEWADHVASYLPSERLEIDIKRLQDNERTVTLKPLGERFEEICKEL